MLVNSYVQAMEEAHLLASCRDTRRVRRRARVQQGLCRE